MTEMEGMTLTKFLGNSGVCSRRAAAGWIAAGRVTVNGEIPVQGLGGSLRRIKSVWTAERCISGRRNIM